MRKVVSGPFISLDGVAESPDQAGGPSLVRWLLHHDLLDELRLLVHPVVAGKGKRSGTAILVYRPYSGPPAS